MPVFACPRTGCEYKTEDLDGAQAIVFLQIHGGEHDTQNAAIPAPAAQQTAQAGEKVRRPSI